MQVFCWAGMPSVLWQNDPVLYKVDGSGCDCLTTVLRRWSPVSLKGSNIHELTNGAAIAAHMQGGPIFVRDSHVRSDSEPSLLRTPLLFIQRKESHSFWGPLGSLWSWNAISLALDRCIHLFHGEDRLSGMSLFTDRLSFSNFL